MYYTHVPGCSKVSFTTSMLSRWRYLVSSNQSLERLLSPRLLHFSRNQIFWDCATLSACETLPGEIPAVLQNQAATDRHWRERLQDTALMIPPISGTANHSLEAFWSSAVLSYTSCNITKQSDKLKALWGIAKLVRDALSEEYGAGLWEPELHQQLAWRVVDWEKSVRTKDLDLGFPSWSWPSVSGPIEVASRMTGYMYYKITDHGGQPLFLKVNNRVYARRIESGFSDWNDEIRFMTAELAQRQAKIVSEIQKAGSNAEPMPRSQPEAVLIDKAVNSHANMMPELENATLEIQGHISRGRMVMSSEDRDCQIIVQTPSGSTFSIGAFPDERPEAEKTECLFVVLSAGRHNGYDDDDSTYYYSGNGIMVRFEGDNRYRRIGAVTFHDLESEMWDAFRHQCCHRTIEEGEHSLGSGTMFF